MCSSLFVVFSSRIRQTRCALLTGVQTCALPILATDRHALAFDEQVISLPIGGLYRQRAGAEAHAYSAQLMHLLQTSVATDSYSTYLQFSRGVRDVPAVSLLELLEFNFACDGISIDQVTERTSRASRTSMS